MMIAQLLQRAVTLHQQNRLPEAEKLYRDVLSLDAQQFDALNLLGAALFQQGRAPEAIAFLDRALSVRRNHPVALLRLGAAHRAAGDEVKAEQAYRRAIRSEPGFVEAHYNLANLLDAQRRHDEAIEAYKRVIKIQPDNISALINLGNALLDLDRVKDAYAVLSQAVALHPTSSALRAGLVSAMQKLCLWTGFADHLAALQRMGRATDFDAHPFAILMAIDDPALQLRAARAASRRIVGAPALASTPPPGDKIRVAYVSADFHQHATGVLMAEMFELHDRNAFDVVAISTGPDDGSAMRKRLASAFKVFVDAREMSDAAIATEIMRLGCHIAVDLKGHTRFNRLGVFARRPAPIQVSYLGFPGSVGAGFIDYVIADDVVLPHDLESHFAEKVVRLPGPYQVNDRSRAIASKAPTRAECGLPESAVVFCCFNQNYKLTPRMFDVWMSILREAPDSVLWLLADDGDVKGRLREEAARRGVAPERLVFAATLPHDQHLARHRHADLFLDTLPCNAHTTASDALWAGLPILTCAGSSFAARVGASLATAAGLSELVAADLEAYQAMAVALAATPERLRMLRERLQAERDGLPPFDAVATTRSIEDAYRTMVRRWRSGLPPESFLVGKSD